MAQVVLNLVVKAPDVSEISFQSLFHGRSGSMRGRGAMMFSERENTTNRTPQLSSQLSWKANNAKTVPQGVPSEPYLARLYDRGRTNAGHNWTSWTSVLGRPSTLNPKCQTRTLYLGGGPVESPPPTVFAMFSDTISIALYFGSQLVYVSENILLGSRSCHETNSGTNTKRKPPKR